jgi:pyruvate ferredoxin oxidoreductase alpha subunit
MAKRFLSGNEAFAEGVRLARPQVISAYPITPQTTCVEALASMVESGALEAEYLHVESEHSALSAAIGASMAGARAFTATSSQGLLYPKSRLHSQSQPDSYPILTFLFSSFSGSSRPV